MNETLLDGEPGPGLLESLWKYRWMVSILAVLGALAGVLLSQRTDTTYEATARVILRDPAVLSANGVNTGARARDPERHLLNEAHQMRSNAVFVAAARRLGEESVSALRSAVEITPAVDLDLITVAATAPEARLAAARANAIVQSYEDVARGEVQATVDAATDQLEALVDRLDERIAELRRTLALNPDDLSTAAQQQAAVQRMVELQTEAERLNVNASLYGSGVELFERADVPGAATGPAPLRNGLMGAVLGFVLAAALAWWRAGRAHTAETGEEAEVTLDVPMLARVPAPRTLLPGLFEVGGRPFLIHDADVERLAGEAYNFLATSLELSLSDSVPSAVLITSAQRGDGKTVTAVNTALAAASDGRRVIVVDGDGGRTSTNARLERTVTAITGLNDQAGLSDFVEYERPIDACLHRVSLGASDVVVMPRGSRRRLRPGFYRLPAFRKAMTELKERADLIIVDSPPALAVSDTAALASHVDAVLLVVNHGTDLEQIDAVRDQLRLSNTPLLGYVFNRARPHRPGGMGRLRRWQ